MSSNTCEGQRRLTRAPRLCALVAGIACVPSALAQGQDSTPWEREVTILAEFLPGRYDNMNQVYFDTRRSLPKPQRHDRRHVRIVRVEGLPGHWLQYREYDVAQLDRPRVSYWLELMPDNAAGAVRMRRYDASAAAAATEAGPVALAAAPPATAATCDVLWRRDAGQFTGSADAACGGEWAFSRDQLWIARPSGAPDTVTNPYALQRTRDFECLADIPGVAGGRDEKFERYVPLALYDKGGEAVFTTRDAVPKTYSLMLNHVTWPINNETGAFTRDSLVLYVREVTATGPKTLTYAWTQPDAERVGINLQWMLVNCYRVSNRDARPSF